MKPKCLKSALNCNSFDVAQNFVGIKNIGIKIQFFRVFGTIEPGQSLLQFAHHELFDRYYLLLPVHIHSFKM